MKRKNSYAQVGYIRVYTLKQDRCYLISRDFLGTRSINLYRSIHIRNLIETKLNLLVNI